ncbi:hypothetical protein [Komagataeibacter swingsii]|uniref:hypothetical protein n=1 Tax=Komagataeibacter swingsii TaxID=215220 RepID=UPI000D7D21AF|nr:hypothetical protein [Komagataeibacter swingsii]
MKLFAEASKERRLFEKRQHPKTFIVFYQWVVFKQSLTDREAAKAFWRRLPGKPCRKTSCGFMAMSQAVFPRRAFKTV